jgi:hypothetical protein
MMKIQELVYDFRRTWVRVCEKVAMGEKMWLWVIVLLLWKS